MDLLNTMWWKGWRGPSSDLSPSFLSPIITSINIFIVPTETSLKIEACLQPFFFPSSRQRSFILYIQKQKTLYLNCLIRALELPQRPEISWRRQASMISVMVKIWLGFLNKNQQRKRRVLRFQIIHDHYN